MKIRTAEKKDCTKCMDIAWNAGLDTPDYEGIQQGFFEAYVDEEELFLVAEIDGEIMGFVLGQIMKAALELMAQTLHLVSTHLAMDAAERVNDFYSLQNSAL